MQQQINRLQNVRKKYSTIAQNSAFQNITTNQSSFIQKRRQIQNQLNKRPTEYKKLKYSFLSDDSNFVSQCALPKLRKQYKSKREKSELQNKGNSFTTSIISENLRQKHQQKQLIRINLANSRYKVTQNVCNQLELVICHEQAQQGRYQISKWDLKWTDSAVTADFISKLSKNQRINFFCGISSISRKNQLISNLSRMKEQFKQQYNFFPQTFQFPSQNAKLNKYYRDRTTRRQNPVFIVKPEASCQGRGIYLCNSLYDIECQSRCVVQNYISNPMLFKGLKFDLRVYALITNSNPLSIFIYREGLVRLATQKYQYPDQSNFQNLFMHLTNYAINKNSPNYKFNKSVQDLKYGHKQSLAQFFKLIQQKGFHSHQIWNQIKSNIVKTLISVQPHLNHQYRIAQPKNQDSSVCYHVLGFDFMTDENGKCYLLQVNQTPSYSTQAPIDYLIKSYLIKDTLNIIKNERNQSMNRSKITHRIQIRRKQKAQYKQKQYDTWELLNEKQKGYLGNYQRIYPSRYQQTQKQYQKLLAFSKVSYSNMYQSQKNKKQTYKFYLKEVSKIPKSKTIANRSRQIQRVKTQASQQKLQKNKIYQDNNMNQKINTIKLYETSTANLVNSLKIPTNNIKSFIQKRRILSKIQNQQDQTSKINYSSHKILQKLKSGELHKEKIQRLYRNPLQNVIQQRQFYQKQLQTNSNKETNANQ